MHTVTFHAATVPPCHYSVNVKSYSPEAAIAKALTAKYLNLGYPLPQRVEVHRA